MTTKTQHTPSSEAFDRARMHWRGLHVAPNMAPRVKQPGSPFTIAISRECGAGGGAIAREVGRRMDWPVYNRALVTSIAEEPELRSELFESVPETRLGWVVHYLDEFSKRACSQDARLEHLAQVLLSLAAHGDCVLVGAGAAFLLPADTTLRVRIVSPLDDRVSRFAPGDARLGNQERLHMVSTIDRQRAQFARETFDVDCSNMQLYDAVLNASRFSTVQCAELILEALYGLQLRNAS